MRNFKIMVIVIFLILLMGCHAANITPFKESSLELTSREEEEQQQSSDHLVVWTHQNIFENSLPRYKEKYPNIQVDIVTEKPQNLVEKYRKSLISGVTPDLYVIPDDVLGEFSGITGFENLNEKPYYDKAFFASRPKGLLNNYIDSEDKMYAMPLLFFPYVTYYRADILEENGYPSDPYHLSIFLNNRDNWMKLAEDLQVKQQYIIESEQMMLEMILRTSSFLDENYDYVGKHEAFQTITNAATDVVDKGLSPHLNIWHEQGQTAINNDQLVMFQMASYVKDSLKVWAPDQAGKWGITTLPFHLSGVDKPSSMSIAISDKSSNKELAWSFAKMMSNDMFNIYESAENDPYYINEDLKSIYLSAMDRDSIGKPQPIDQQIKFIWDVAMKEFQDGKEMNREAINKVHYDVQERIKYEQRALKQSIHEIEKADSD